MRPLENKAEEQQKSWWDRWGWLIYFLSVKIVTVDILDNYFSTQTAYLTACLLAGLTMYPLFIRRGIPFASTKTNKPLTFWQWTGLVIVWVIFTFVMVEYVFKIIRSTWS